MIDWTGAQSGRVQAGGAVLEYNCHGPSPAEAPTIVMLHEGLGCTALWRDFPAQVAAITGCGVFVYSRRGYGQSDPVRRPRPLDYMTREAVEVLPEVLDSIGFRRGILLGHSDGATIAAIYAGSVQDHRLRGLILMAPHFFTERAGLEEIARRRADFETGGLRARMEKYHRDADGAFLGWADAWLDPGFVDWNVADVIDYLRIPVLAIQGRDDQYGSLAQIGEIADRSYAPVETAILPDCGHAPHLAQPDVTLQHIDGFVACLHRIEAAVVATG